MGPRKGVPAMSLRQFRKTIGEVAESSAASDGDEAEGGDGDTGACVESI